MDDSTYAIQVELNTLFEYANCNENFPYAAYFSLFGTDFLSTITISPRGILFRLLWWPKNCQLTQVFDVGRYKLLLRVKKFHQLTFRFQRIFQFTSTFHCEILIKSLGISIIIQPWVTCIRFQRAICAMQYFAYEHVHSLDYLYRDSCRWIKLIAESSLFQ